MKTIQSILLEMAVSARKETINLLRSVPKERHNWRPQTGSRSFAEIAFFLHNLDLWLLEKHKDGELAVFPDFKIKSYDRSEDLFANSVLELSRLQEQRDAVIRDLTEGRLTELVFDERYGEIPWLQLLLEGYIGIEQRQAGIIHAYLELID